MRLRKTKLLVVLSYLTILILLISLLKNDGSLYILKYVYIIILSLGYIIFAILMYLKDSYYIYFNDENEKIIIRYYSLRSLAKGASSVEIPKSSFINFKLIPFYFNKKVRLLLYQQTSKGIAKYPPISLSGLNEKEIKKLTDSLRQYCTGEIK